MAVDPPAYVRVTRSVGYAVQCSIVNGVFPIRTQGRVKEDIFVHIMRNL